MGMLQTPFSSSFLLLRELRSFKSSTKNRERCGFFCRPRSTTSAAPSAPSEASTPTTLVPFLLLLISFLVPNVSAVDGVATPTLPFGDINVIALTDVHSWVGGHGRNEANLNADYGDVLSFYEHIQAHCRAPSSAASEADTKMDLWFVMNGDWIDGTGLALDGDPSHLVPLLQKMPWDVVNTGNHELYKSEVVDYMRRPAGFIDWWGNRHLSSNVVMAGSDDPLSNLYVVLNGRSYNLLVFGFLYNLPNPSPMVNVVHVEDAVKKEWFRNALEKEEYDAILVMAHMGTDDDSVAVIRDAIRQIVGADMPIQFITGHTHLRKYASIDANSASFEAGRFLDTVGFVSFPTRHTVQSVNAAATSDASLTNETAIANINGSTTHPDLFRHVFIDGNVKALQMASGQDEDDFHTRKGLKLSEYIHQTQQALGLYDTLGCAPKNYFVNRSLAEPDSLWALYVSEVVPTQFFERGQSDNQVPPRAIIVSQGSWRYDLFGRANDGLLLYDDIVAVSPFNENIYFVASVPWGTLRNLFKVLNTNSTPYFNTLPAYIMAGPEDEDVDDNLPVDLHCHHFELETIAIALTIIAPGVEIVANATNMTSTGIWVSFVQDEWPCTGQGNDDNDNKTNETTLTNGTNNGGGEDGPQGDDGNGNILLVFMTLAFSIIFLFSGLFACYIALEQVFYDSIPDEGFGVFYGDDEGEFA